MRTNKSRTPVLAGVGLLLLLAVVLTVAAEFQSIKRYLKIRSM